MSNQTIVDVAISYEEFERVYRGEVDSVHCVDLHGKSIRFPANILQSFLTPQGVRGRFAINFDRNHKFSGITRLG